MLTKTLKSHKNNLFIYIKYLHKYTNLCLQINNNYNNHNFFQKSWD